MTILKNIWFWVISTTLLLAGFVSVLMFRRKDAVERMLRNINVAKAKMVVDSLATKTAADEQSLQVLADQRAAADAAMQDAVTNFARHLKDVGGMTDADVDVELTRRGYR